MQNDAGTHRINLDGSGRNEDWIDRKKAQAEFGARPGAGGHRDRAVLALPPEICRALRRVAALRDTTMIDAVAQLASEELARQGISSQDEEDLQV